MYVFFTFLIFKGKETFRCLTYRKAARKCLWAKEKLHKSEKIESLSFKIARYTKFVHKTHFTLLRDKERS